MSSEAPPGSGKIKLATLAVMTLFVALALAASVNWLNPWPSDTLEPLAETPATLSELPTISLVAMLNRSKLDQLTLVGETHVLHQKPVFQRLPDANVPHPSQGVELRLDWADPKVYAEPSQAGGYRFIVFCAPQRQCFSELSLDAPPLHRPVAFLRFGAEDAEAARTQLEVLRRLILLEGGQSTSESGKTLAQRLRELPQDPG